MRPTRSQLLVPRQTIDRRIVGTPEYVTAAIQRLQADRRLVFSSPFLDTAEGVQVTVRILAPTEPAPTPTPARPRRWPLVTAAVTTGATALSVAAYAAIQLVNAVIDALPVIGGALLLLALVAVLARSRSGRTFSGTFTGRLD